MTGYIIVYKETNDLEDYYFHLLASALSTWSSQCTNDSHSKSKFLAERDLRSTLDFYINMVIYKPF